MGSREGKENSSRCQADYFFVLHYLRTMAGTKTVNIDKLKPDDKNFNKGTQYGKHLIDKSFEQFGAGRSILIDKNGHVIAGNKSLESYAEGGGEKVIVVETDGKTLIAVKRTDVNLNTKKGREMALADNATAKADIVFADDVIVETIPVEVAESWGLNIKVKKRDFEGGGGAGDIDIDKMTFPGEDLQVSHVRMVQLFLNTETEPKLRSIAEKLQPEFGTTNLTDTIFEAMKFLDKNITLINGTEKKEGAKPKPNAKAKPKAKPKKPSAKTAPKTKANGRTDGKPSRKAPKGK